MENHAFFSPYVSSQYYSSLPLNLIASCALSVAWVWLPEGQTLFQIMSKAYNKKFKKGVGIAIKSKETSSKIAGHTNTVGRYTHACINEAHSLANLQDLIPTLAGLCCL